MSRNISVIVIGAGIVGCAIARELAVRGAACEVFDDRPIGGGATQASAGMLAPFVEAARGTPMLDLCVRSLDLYDAWMAEVRAESGIDVEYRRIGTLEVALGPAHAADLRARASGADGESRTWLEPDAARTRVAALGTIAGALYTPRHGYVAAPQLVAALAASAMRRGATFRVGRVRRVKAAAGSIVVTSTLGDTRADAVVVAAGAWTSGIAGVRTAPVRPVRGQLVQLGWIGDPLQAIVWGPECYIVPRADGTLLVGATVEEVGFDERATSAGVRDLLDAACELLPAAWGATFAGVRVGLRPATPDDLPAIGDDSEAPGVFHATGHYRNGVLLAPVTARLIADAIVDGRRDPAFDAFNPRRFAE